MCDAKLSGLKYLQKGVLDEFSTREMMHSDDLQFQFQYETARGDGEWGPSAVYENALGERVGHRMIYRFYSDIFMPRKTVDLMLIKVNPR